MKKHYLALVAMAAMAAPAFGQVRAAAEPVKLLSAPCGLMAPVWSPDGSKIAVTSDNYQGIFIAEADGANLRQLTADAGTGYKMAWSADSRTILSRAKIEQGGRNFYEMRTYALDGSATVTAAKARTSAQPGATSATGIYRVMTADPANATASVAALGQFAGKTVINPALSPDGSAIAFQIPGKGMWLINADGSGLRSLGQGSHPAWMPDNRTIVYTIVEDNGQNFTASTLRSMDLRTGATADILATAGYIPMTPAVAPDGSKVAFENAADASIYVVELAK